MHRLRCSALLLATLVLASSPAAARWRDNGVPFVYSGGQVFADATASTNGGVSAVIQAGFGGSPISVVRIDGAGDEQWLPTSLLAGGNSELISMPAVIAGPSDDLYAGWMQWDYDPFLFTYTTLRARVQRVNADRSTPWGALGIPAFPTPSGRHSQIQLVPGDAQSALVGVLETDSATYVPVGYRLQRVLADSTRMWGGTGALQPFDDPSTVYGLSPALLADGTGGAYVGWLQASSTQPGHHEWRMQRITPGGTSAWAAYGEVALAVDAAPASFTLHGDGAGGVIAVIPAADLMGTRLLAHRRTSAAATPWGAGTVELLPYGEIASPTDVIVRSDANGLRAAWKTPSGSIRMRRFSLDTGAPLGPVVTLTGSQALSGFDVVALDDGGSIVVWSGNAAGTWRVRAQKVDAADALAWNSGGMVLAAMPSGSATLYRAVSDGEGGAVAVFLSSTILTAQRVLADGDLPMLAGRLNSVSDVPGDEGGWVRLGYTAPYADPDEESPEVTGYNVWRLIPGSAAAAAGARPADEAEALAALESATHGRSRITPAQALRLRFPPGSWESLGFHAAVLDTGYGFVVGTLNDSGPATPDARETFVVTAHTASASVFGVSEARIGRSLDNLAPAAPQALAGAFAAGALHLSWAANGEPDVERYRVYRGPSGSFVPGPGTLIAEVNLPAHLDGGFASGLWYKVIALDRHGNASAAATLAPSAVTDAPAPVAAVNFLRAPGANPARGDVAVEYGLALEGPARLSVLDAQGRLLHVLADGPHRSGAHRVTWTRRAEHAGLYFVRLESAGLVATRKVVLGR